MIRKLLSALAAIALLAAQPALAGSGTVSPSGGGSGLPLTGGTLTGTLAVNPSSTSVKAITVNLPSGSSQNMAEWANNGTKKFFVDYNGGLAANGSVLLGGSIGWYVMSSDTNRTQLSGSNASCLGELTLARDTNFTTTTRWVPVSNDGPFQLGTCNTGTPTARYIQGEGSRSGTDSNVGGADFYVRANLGTGTGTQNKVVLQSSIATTSGTGAQSFATGLTITGGVAKLAVYTVSTLPTCSVVGAGSQAFVSDATAPTYNGALTGGGSVGVPVTCDGTAWHSA